MLIATICIIAFNIIFWGTYAYARANKVKTKFDGVLNHFIFTIPAGYKTAIATLDGREYSVGRHHHNIADEIKWSAIYEYDLWIDDYTGWAGIKGSIMRRENTEATYKINAKHKVKITVNFE